MRVLVFSGSPKNDDSITLQSMYFFEKLYVDDEFDIKIVGTGKFKDEYIEAVEKADLIIYISSLFHFFAHQQSIVFFDEMEKACKDKLKDKPFTYFSGSIRNYDVAAHSFMESRIKSLGAKYIPSWSSKDSDLFSDEGKNEICAWYEYVREFVTTPTEDVKAKHNHHRVILLDGTDGNNELINQKMQYARDFFKEHGIEKVDTYAIRDYKIQPCISCSACYTNGLCVLNDKDTYIDLFKEVEKDNDICISFGEQNYGSYGSVYKAWLDRHVQFGRRPSRGYDLEPFLADVWDSDGYFSKWTITGCVTDSTNESCSRDFFMLRERFMTYAAFGGETFAGVYEANDKLAALFDTKPMTYDEFLANIILLANNEIRPQKNFYGEGVYKNFKDLAFELQRHTPVDYEFFKSEGCYEEIKPNDRVVPVQTMEEGIAMRHNRLTPYKFAIAEIKNGWKPTKNVRRNIAGDIKNHCFKLDETGEEKKKWKLFKKK